MPPFLFIRITKCSLSHCSCSDGSGRQCCVDWLLRGPGRRGTRFPSHLLRSSLWRVSAGAQAGPGPRPAALRQRSAPALAATLSVLTDFLCEGSHHRSPAKWRASWGHAEADRPRRRGGQRVCVCGCCRHHVGLVLLGMKGGSFLLRLQELEALGHLSIGTLSTSHCSAAHGYPCALVKAEAPGDKRSQ